MTGEADTPFAVIPVLDLRGGCVVRARAGERQSYAPIETPLAKGSAPAEIARGLLGAVPARILYVADLDAIVDGAPPDRAALEAIARACPGVALWVDAGFRDGGDVAAFRAHGIGRPVIGSESQADEGLVARLGDSAVFSLDSRGDKRLGPASLHADARHWPADVIVMTLSRIGIGSGPDLAGLAAARRLAPDHRIHAAGGVRGPDDVAALRGAGIAGALVASAIHDRALRAEHLR